MRRSGRTTRIIDELVQDYFNFGCFMAMDHEFGNGPRLKRSQEIFDLVAFRLRNEHKIIIEFKDVQKKASCYMYFCPVRCQ